MAYTPHFLLTYGGDMCGGNEIWANNIRLADPGNDLPLANLDPEEELPNFAADIRALAANAASKWSSNVRCTWVKFNAIGADGNYQSSTESNTLILTGADIIVGGVGSPMPPPQISVCVTFRTALQRGRGSRGRIFAPRPAVEAGGLGTMDSTTATGMATAYRAFIVALGDTEGLDGQSYGPVVASGVNGALNRITRVEVGNVLDTQRRRRNNLNETYVGSDV